LDATYTSIRSFAKAIGRSHPSVLAWFKDAACPVKSSAPWTDADVQAAKAYAASLQPNRNYRSRQPAPPSVPPAPSPAMPPATPTVVAPESEAIAATLEDLERQIRTATNNDLAERLSKQVRALKVVREILDKDGERIDTVKARAEIRSVFHFFQTACMGLPRAVSGTMEGLTAAEIEGVLAGRMTELLGELKRGLQRAIESDSDPVALDGNGEQSGRARAIVSQPVGGEVSNVDEAAEQPAGSLG
jgi:hypothetical protein